MSLINPRIKIIDNYFRFYQSILSLLTITDIAGCKPNFDFNTFCEDCVSIEDLKKEYSSITNHTEQTNIDRYLNDKFNLMLSDFKNLDSKRFESIEIHLADYLERLEKMKDVNSELDYTDSEMEYIGCLFRVFDNDTITLLDLKNNMQSQLENEMAQLLNLKTSQPHQTKTPFQLPAEILDKLEQAELIQREPLQWLKTNALLAYFVDVANDKLNLKHGEKRLIRPFEQMFNVSGLSNAINNYKKTGDLPISNEVIMNIFKIEQ